MKVFFHPRGAMSHYLPLGQYTIELKNSATLADFYNELGLQMGDKLSPTIWNAEKKQFRAPVFIKLGKKILRKDSEPLHDCDNLALCMFVTGG